MNSFKPYGIQVPHFLIPKDIDVSTWSVIACDQYTQDEGYWKKAREAAGQNPSTLDLILPEVYLKSADKSARIEKIRENMKAFIKKGVFDEEKNGFVYIERSTAFGRMRRGLLAQIDLESYDWKPFSKANIRATEATILDRIPPRMEIRRGAPLELPHIMLLANDRNRHLVEGAGILAKNKDPLYSGSLMNNGGSIKGWLLDSEEEIACIQKAIESLALENRDSDGSTFLFAVGDGNHSLATAKAVWDEHKEKLLAEGVAEEDLAKCPVRYALVEIVNIYDEGLTFEPIHRVVFNADNGALIQFLAKQLDGTLKAVEEKEALENFVKNSSSSFGFAYMDSGVQKYVLLETKMNQLAVSRLQPELDSFLKDHAPSSEIDYIHGAEEVFELGRREKSLGIMLPPIFKDSFFDTINGRGPLPRKSFSMGEADEKRFYLECRRLFS